jgi:hypothetical protein
MSLPLTPELLAACYDFLAATKPFCNWQLPDSETIQFKVLRTRERYGDHQMDGSQHVIRVSSGKVGHTMTLVETMAHELIHVHMAETGMAGSAEHGAAFHRLAEQVCRVHGFDPKDF